MWIKFFSQKANDSIPPPPPSPLDSGGGGAPSQQPQIHIRSISTIHNPPTITIRLQAAGIILLENQKRSRLAHSAKFKLIHGFCENARQRFCWPTALFAQRVYSILYDEHFVVRVQSSFTRKPYTRRGDDEDNDDDLFPICSKDRLQIQV